jgi:hypothetical protein
LPAGYAERSANKEDMNFDKNERHVLKYFSFYRGFPIIVIVASSLLVLFGIYVIVFKGPSPIDNALTAAAVVVLACGYLMLVYTRIIDKFKGNYQNKDKN